MADSQRSRLTVEGTDDLHTIIHLLDRHEVVFEAKVEIKQPEDGPTGKDGVLAAIRTRVKAATDRIEGFVLDADSPIAQRWQAVADRLEKAGVSPPHAIPARGFVADVEEYRTRVGVWLMPDNRQDGTLEQLLETLVDRDAPLFRHATESTAEAKELGATFPAQDEPKARLHTWLAWQEEPGRPYGTAIKAEYFQHDSHTAETFVAWFRHLFRLEQ